MAIKIYNDRSNMVNNPKKKGQKNMNGPLYHILFQLNLKCTIKSTMNEMICNYKES